MRKFISMMAVAGVAIAAPALAQPKAPDADRAMAQAIAWQKRVVDVFNTRDPAGVAALYAADAVFVDPSDKVAKGRAAIAAAEAASFKAWGDFTFASTVKEAHAVGKGFWFTFDTTIDAKGASGPFTVRLHGLNVVVRQGKERKIAATSLGLNPPPPAAPP